MRRLLAILLLTGCSGAPSSGGANLVVAVATAVTASAVSRSGGGCYAVCSFGTACNSATGMCDALPCRGQCSASEVCERVGTQELCVTLNKRLSANPEAPPPRAPDAPYMVPGEPFPAPGSASAAPR